MVNLKSLKISFFLIILSSVLLSAARRDSLDVELDRAIEQKHKIDAIKNKRILTLKKLILDNDSDYNINEKLYGEYRKYKIDSAIIFIKRNINISERIKDKNLNISSQIKLANLYSSSGKYIEAQEILHRINPNKLSISNKALYYETFSQFYEHYTTNNNNIEYSKRIETYRDSLLSILPPNSIKYKTNTVQRDIYHNKYDRAKNTLLSLLKETKSQDANYAMITYLLGDIYKHKNDAVQEEKFYKLAAITDIKNSIKDNAAVQSLAVINFNKGNIERAYKFTQSAIDDAVICNVKFRTLSISELYSIINTNYLKKVEYSESQLKTYLISISLLTLFLIIMTVFLIRQIRKNTLFRKELILNSKQLERLNKEIQQTNIKLKDQNLTLNETNHIKEIYIAQFFDMCSSYINKLEDYRKSLSKKAQSKQFEELAIELKSTSFTKNELDYLYHTFDNIFVNLYPNFIKEFNDLLIPEERIVLKPTDILNTELRVFALIRLGITDSVKIAAFLRYSLSTIYNYRTKARNKALITKDEFEIMLSKIGNGTEIK